MHGHLRKYNGRRQDNLLTFPTKQHYFKSKLLLKLYYQKHKHNNSVFMIVLNTSFAFGQKKIFLRKEIFHV